MLAGMDQYLLVRFSELATESGGLYKLGPSANDGYNFHLFKDLARTCLRRCFFVEREVVLVQPRGQMA